MTIGEQIIRKLDQYKGFDAWWSGLEPRWREQVINDLSRFVVLRVEDAIEQALTTLTTTENETDTAQTK